MANRTDPGAASIHGTNPQNLVEKIIRSKIYNSLYWKEHCFALNAETVVDKCMELRAVGGTYGGSRLPSNFMCLVLKLLQIQPDAEVVREYILQEDSKYLRLLGAFYLRLTGQADQVYRYLEPLFNDLRKVRELNADGGYSLGYVDRMAEHMLYKDYVFDIALPRLPKRVELESQGLLGPRKSGMDKSNIAELEEKLAQEHAQLHKEIGQPKRGERAAGRIPQAESAQPQGYAKDRQDDDVRLRLKKSHKGAAHKSGDLGMITENRRNRDDGAGADEYGQQRNRYGGHTNGSTDRSRRHGEDSRGSYQRDAQRDRHRDDVERHRNRGGRYERVRYNNGFDRAKTIGDDLRGRDSRHERSYTDRSRGHDWEDRDRKTERGDRDRSRRDAHREAKVDKDSDRGSKRKRSGVEESMSIEETNKLRAELGLKPLK